MIQLDLDQSAQVWVAIGAALVSQCECVPCAHLRALYEAVKKGENGGG